MFNLSAEQFNECRLTLQAIKYCQCTWEGVSTTIPIEDFLKFERDEAMSPSSNLVLRELVAKCGGRANDLQLLNQ